MNNKSRGFTLIELLVVIAIIGILSSVVLASLSSARVKARIGAAQSTMSGLNPGLEVCLNDSVAITIGADETEATWTGANVCTGGPKYPELPTGWVYCDAAVGTGCTTASAQVTGTSYSISISGDGKVVTATESGVTTN